MAKKFEKTMNKVARYKEELKMGCTTTKGVVRPLTREEIAFRKGFCDTVDNAVVVKNGSQNGLLDPLYENQMSGVSSAFAHMRGEKKYQKNKKDFETYQRVKGRYEKKPYPNNNKTNNPNNR